MDVVIRATVIFFALYLVVRLLGKRELAQLTPFELIVLVVTGDLIQQGVTHNDFSLTGAILAVATFAFWASVLSWITYLSRRAERFLDGQPRVIVRDGLILRENLRHDRLTEAEIQSEMRLAGIAHVRDVAWAILERTGKMSFIKREEASDGDERQPNTDKSTVV
ncbi:MAG: DUF421 domain-containing protein [Candidatus Limnocylindria bacterium]